MSEKDHLIAFGPVPSRRLGQSMGINNIPPKVCSYSCVYCQVGKTSRLRVSRNEYFRPKELVNEVETQVEQAKLRGERIDYLTFVSDGEPTLDINIGIAIETLRSLGIKIAVITNSSLLWDESVRNDLLNTDLVSVKIDTVVEDTWREMNRPHGSLHLPRILSGILEFSKEFNGKLITESMYTRRSALKIDEVKMTADFIAEVNPYKSYISIPTRPPAEKWVKSPSESELFNVFVQYSERGIGVEYLIGYEGNEFAFTGDAVYDLLSITSVHPMREAAVRAYLKKAHKNWDAVESLLKDGKLKEIFYTSDKFFLRNHGAKKTS